eukprot:544451-Pelagomonas_calceolata.AAC.4
MVPCKQPTEGQQREQGVVVGSTNLQVLLPQRSFKNVNWLAHLLIFSQDEVGPFRQGTLILPGHDVRGIPAQLQLKL